MSIPAWFFYPLAGALILLVVYVATAVICAVVMAIREAFTRPYK